MATTSAALIASTKPRALRSADRASPPVCMPAARPGCRMARGSLQTGAGRWRSGITSTHNPGPPHGFNQRSLPLASGPGMLGQGSDERPLLHGDTGLPTKAMALGLEEDALAEADILGRDLHDFILSNEVQSLLQAHQHWRSELDGYVRR